MRINIILISIIFVFCAGANPIFALTEVQGVISTNTTWTQANSPYILLGNVDISSGVTLTIQPGVRIEEGPSTSGQLNVSGTLTAIGSNELPIKINGVSICLGSSSSSTTQVNIRYAEIRYCGLLANNSRTGGTLTVLDSQLIYLSGVMTLTNLTNSFDVERNLFLESYGIECGTNQQGILKNNVFYNQQGAFAVYGNPQTFIYNSFLSSDRCAVKAKTGTTTITAANNYWNTTNTSTINSMIYDHADDSTYQTVSYTPILTSPHASTPVVNIVHGTTILDSDTSLSQKYSVYDTVVVKGNAVVDIGTVNINKLVVMDNSTVNILGANIGNPHRYGTDGIWSYGTSKIYLFSCSISKCVAEEKSNVGIFGEVSSYSGIVCSGSSICDVNGTVLSSNGGLGVFDNATLNIIGGYVYPTISSNNLVVRVDIPTDEHLAGSCINISGGKVEHIGNGTTEINVFGKNLAKFPYDGKYQCGQVTGFWNNNTPIYLNLLDATYPYIILHESGLPPQIFKSDLNGDGIVNFLDFSILSSEWLK